MEAPWRRCSWADLFWRGKGGTSKEAFRVPKPTPGDTRPTDTNGPMLRIPRPVPLGHLIVLKEKAQGLAEGQRSGGKMRCGGVISLRICAKQQIHAPWRPTGLGDVCLYPGQRRGHARSGQQVEWPRMPLRLSKHPQWSLGDPQRRVGDPVSSRPEESNSQDRRPPSGAQKPTPSVSGDQKL